MVKRTLFLLGMVSTLISPAFAEVKIVATLPWIGSIAREIGKDRVNVAVLVKPNQDPHYMEARPGMVLAASKADVIMYNGLDLEAGYLPLIITSSRNPDLQPGRKGNLDCSRFVEPIERPQGDIDRSMGDVHPLGNPHYHYSPPNILRVAGGMANALAALDRANADFYRANFRNFAERLKERQKNWHAASLKGKKFVAYHKLFEYLADEFGFQLVGYVEQKPGIPPSAGHIENLIEEMKIGKPGGILTTRFYGKKASESLSEKTGVKVIDLPADVGSMAGTDDWFSFMDKVLSSLK